MALDSKLINITTYASGSSGNCYRIDDEKTVLLVEAGIQIRKIRKAFNFKLSKVDACLITHEHGDHSKSVKDVIKAGIDTYMSPGTAEALGLSSHRIKAVKHGELFSVGSFKIMPFSVQHDAQEPLGFLLASGEDKILFATDTYYIKYRFSGLTHIMIESNYSQELLDRNIASGVAHASLRNRVMKSHFEIENVKTFLKANDLTKVKEIHLIHISGNNGDPKLFKEEIQKLTGKPVYIATD